MKKIIIGVVALVLLGGGGAAGWWFFLRDNPDAGKVKEVVFPPKPNFITIGAFEIPVIEGNVVKRQIRVRIAVEMVPDAFAFALRGQGVPLRDAYLTELNAMVVWHRTDGGHNLHLPSMKKRLLKVTEDVVGKGLVKDVLVNMILEQG